MTGERRRDADLAGGRPAAAAAEESQPRIHPGRGLRVQELRALLVALADEPARAARAVILLDQHVGDLGAPAAGGVEHSDQRGVADVGRALPAAVVSSSCRVSLESMFRPAGRLLPLMPFRPFSLIWSWVSVSM